MEDSLHNSVLSVDTQNWLEAQEFERKVWVRDNQKNSWFQILMKFLRALKNNPHHFFELITYHDFYTGDDWNFWWKDQFENYQALPNHIHKALEVGSGPYTNIRIINELKQIDEIHCLDPLMDLYLTFRLNWISRMAKKNKISAHTGKGEELPFENNTFDLVVSNNVLDHVQNATKCLSEAYRVLKPGGYFVFGQDLSNEEDIKKQLEEDKGHVGHPIKLHEEVLDSQLERKYEIRLKKILPRNMSRNPRHHYGTYVFIGVKK